MEKLTKLQLDNNIITKIQGLESLVNLTWLDLSFNLIEKIEGLETLYQLEDLSLFSNRITKLENLDALINLNLLSVGENEIYSLDDTVKYLAGLKNNLEVLQIKENRFKEKIQDGKEYKPLVIAYLSNLKYLDYELIDQKERDAALENHKDEVTNFKTGGENDEKGDENATLNQELIDAKIEQTQNMFLNVLEKCEDYEKVRYFIKY